MQKLINYKGLCNGTVILEISKIFPKVKIYLVS